MLVAKAPAGIEDDPDRVGTRNKTRGELWIIGRHGAGANDHNVAQRTQTVDMQNVLVPRHPVRLAGVSRDEPIQALAEVTDRQGPRHGRAADRQVEFEKCSMGIVDRQRGLPSAPRAPDQPRVCGAWRCCP